MDASFQQVAIGPPGATILRAPLHGRPPPSGDSLDCFRTSPDVYRTGLSAIVEDGGSVSVEHRNSEMSIIWTIIIGFIVGVIAKFIMPGKNEPQGFILTAILGIVGAFVATYLGQAIGWYKAGESAGWIGGVVGAVIVLAIYGFFAGRQGRTA
jgi:uncharacterized membrane protein YeaQ/YmgE (transglycosylase-associated protein family)